MIYFLFLSVMLNLFLFWIVKKYQEFNLKMFKNQMKIWEKIHGIS